MKPGSKGKRLPVDPLAQEPLHPKEVPSSPIASASNMASVSLKQTSDGGVFNPELLLQALSHKAGLPGFLHALVAAAAERFAASAVFLGVQCKEQNVLSLEALHVSNAPAASEKTAFSSLLRRTTPTGYLWQELLRTQRSFVISNPAADPRIPFPDLLLADHPAALLVIPVQEGAELLGLLGVMDPGVGTDAAQTVCLPEDLARQLIIGVKLARLAGWARYAAILAERSRIAMDLHDIMAGGFTGVMVQLELAEQLLASNRPEAQRHIGRARRFASESLVEARNAVFALHLQKPAEQRLARSLQQIAADISACTRIQAQFVLHGKEPSLPPETGFQLLGIAQEAVTNILQHAHSARVWIELHSSARDLRLVVRDDGRGFVVSSSAARRGMGLKNMERRARVAGGSLSIASRPARGTEIRVSIPLQHVSSTKKA